MEISDARRTVFGGLIDYAGLFPPASLDITSAKAASAIELLYFSRSSGVSLSWSSSCTPSIT